MPDWLALALVLLACLLLGYLLLRQFTGDEPFSEDIVSLLFLSLTLGILPVGWIAVIMAELGIFSIASLAGVWLLGIVLLTGALQLRHIAWLKFPSVTVAPTGKLSWLPDRWERPFLVLAFIVTLWLFLRPHQFIIGAADAGVYVNLSAHIAQHGRILIQDDTLANLSPAVADDFLRPITNPVAPTYLLPAFYVIGEPAGQVTPQFYPLYPVWQAIPYSLAGLQAALKFTGIWALLGVWAVYMLVREIAGWETAALAAVGLSSNAIQIWFARYPSTEPQTQFLLWVGLWSVAVWLKQPRNAALWGFVSGAAFGSLFLVRIDTVFLAPLILAFVVWLFIVRQRGIWWFTVPFITLAAHSLLHALTQSQPYFYDLYNFGVRSLVRNEAVLLLLVLVGIAAIGVFAKFYASIMDWLNRYRRPLLITAIASIVGLALFGWFIRPYLTPDAAWNDPFSTNTIPDLDHENLIRLGWYLSPIGVWLGVIGICLLIWRFDRKTTLMLGVCLFFSIFYLWQIRANPHQIYTMRRHVPGTLPFFIVGAAYFTGILMQQQRLWLRGLAAFLAFAWLAGLFWSARGFITQVDYADLPAQMDQLDQQLDSNAIVIFSEHEPVGMGDFVGTPLRFLYGHDVYKLYNPEAVPDETLVEQMKTWKANGRSVYWIGDRTWLNDNGLAYTPADFTLTTQALEGTYDHKPTALVTLTWNLHIAHLD